MRNRESMHEMLQHRREVMIVAMAMTTHADVDYFLCEFEPELVVPNAYRSLLCNKNFVAKLKKKSWNQSETLFFFSQSPNSQIFYFKFFFYP